MDAPGRLLVVSAEFDATRSPQGMRWVMLSRALAEQGWEVDVLAFDDAATRDAMPPRVSIERVFPGVYRGALAWLQRRREATPRAANIAGAPPVADVGATANPTSATLNWKGRLDAALRRHSARFVYPDLAREGLPFLRRALRKRLAQHRYAAVLLSHEPPLALMLAGDCNAAGVPCIADLGDPVLAPYTPRRWHRVAAALEQSTCERAACIVVTSDATRTLLQRRHAIDDARIDVITQGFAPATAPSAPIGQEAPLRIAYTGRFYRFRDPRPVLDALSHARDVVLALAVPDLPEWIDPASLASEHIEWHGRLSHRNAIALQAGADALLLIGNDDPAQVPGKLFEYFGVARPILYVTRHADDEGARLVAALRRGLVVADESATIAAALAELARWKQDGTLAERFDLSPAAVSGFAWPALARRYARLVAGIALPSHIPSRSP